MNRNQIVRKMAVVYGRQFNFITGHILISIDDSSYMNNRPEFVFYYDSKPIRLDRSGIDFSFIETGYYIKREEDGFWMIYDSSDQNAHSSKYNEIKWAQGRFKVSNYIDLTEDKG